MYMREFLSVREKILSVREREFLFVREFLSVSEKILSVREGSCL